jgi:3D-(3,5/4)-trihydroxycyclohexane-1,2-dione acylhydrolase (decyclizing)
VLQQVEDFSDSAVSANDCFRPVSRLFDRIVRPEQILDALPKVMATFMDPATCGPATLAFCQDVQAEGFDYPVEFFAKRVWHERRQAPDAGELERLVAAIKQAHRPFVIAGGGVLYSRAEEALIRLCEAAGLPVAETQAGKGGIAWDHPNALGSIGVTGSDAANALASKADLILGVGTRLQDFTTGSRTLFPDCRLFQINVQAFDAHKHGAEPVLGDARVVLDALAERLQGWRSPSAGAWTRAVRQWNEAVNAATALARDDARPSDAQVIGAVQRSLGKDAVVVCASGGLPGELHKLWRVSRPGGYHLEYGFSCMGYEIAGGLGVKMAQPDREVVVMVGDGSYMMLNAELATSVMMGYKLIVTLLDNRGYGCIHRLQHATGGAAFNNLLADARHETLPDLDFAAHARSLGAHAEHVASLDEFEAAMARARASDRSYVVVIETDPVRATEAGGWWWDVAVPEVSDRSEVQRARQRYEDAIRGKLR